MHRRCMLHTVTTFTDEQTLRISVGADKCRRRATQRKTQTWLMSDVFAHHPKVSAVQYE